MTAKQYIKKYQSLIITLILFIVPLLGIFYLAYMNRTYGGTDDTFHWQRFMELRYDIGHGILPQFMTHTSNPLGNAINIFYPYVTLLPYIILTWFIHQPIHLIYAIYSLIWITVSIVSYFCSKSYFDSKRAGLIFSILYTASSTLSNTLLLNDDVGEALSYAWLPLVLFGFLWILRDGSHWLILSLGFTCLIYSHILSSVLMIVAISFIALLNFKSIVKIKPFLNIIKAGILTILLTTFMWRPIIYILHYNKFFNPQLDFDNKFEMSGLLFSTTGNIHENCGFVDGIGIIIGLICIVGNILKKKRLVIPYRDWTIWITGMIFWLTNTDIKPIHNMFKYSPANVLQFSFRTCLILHIFLTYIAVKWLLGYYDNSKNSIHSVKFKRVFITFAIFLALVMQVGNQLNDKLLFQQRIIYTSPHQCRFGLQAGKLMTNHYHHYGKRVLANKITDKSFKYMRNTSLVDDYSPVNTTYVKNKTAYVLRDNFQALINNNFRDVRHVKVSPQGVKLHLHKSVHNITLPIIFYNKCYYKVTDNNKSIKWIRPKKDNFVELPCLSRGNHVIQIHPIVNKTVYNALRISLIGGAIFTISVGFDWLKSRKKSKRHAKSA